MTAYSEFDAIPHKRFGLILADPPWRFRAYAPPKEDAKGRRDTERHYPTMTIEDIKALPVRQVAAKDCYLVLWTSWPFLPQALEVMKAWGFTYSSSFKVWGKLKRSHSPTKAFIENPKDFFGGTGYTTLKNTEFCLLGRRGSPKRLYRGIRELEISPVREHSRKPDSIHGDCERFAAGPYLEMFARATRDGWDQFGNDVQKFDAPPGVAQPPLLEIASAPTPRDLFEEMP